MKRILARKCPALLPVAVFACGSACAQTLPSDAGLANTAPIKLEAFQPESPDRFGVSYRMGFNISVDFKKIGRFPAQGHFVSGPGAQGAAPGTATGSLENRTYEDGYNWVDNNNNSYAGLPPSTHYWGYDSASQVVDNRYIVMHSSSSPGVAASDDNDGDPQHGFELTYQHELARNERWRWGLEAAFGYTDVTADDRRRISSPVNRISDQFEVPADDTGFRFIPSAGFTGTASGAGEPLLGSTPIRTTTVLPAGAAVTGRRNLNADLFGIRLGVYADVPLGDRVQLSFSGGVALVQVNSDFSFNETVTIPGVSGSINNVGSGSHEDLQAGGYVGGSVAVALNKDWSLFGGVQFQDAGRYTHRENGRTAVLDLSQAVFVSFGASYSF